MKRLTYIYFSATGTTSRVARAIGAAMGIPTEREINLADNHSTQLPSFSQDDIAIIACPVYGGRLPQHALPTLNLLRGHEATAIAVVVYGNRDYDDALLELRDILMKRGFKIAGAAAFIGEHSIFPKVATARPDKADMKILEKFGKACRERLEKSSPYSDIEVKGNFPYKKPMGVPLHPKADTGKCNRCGECALKCPSGAIDRNNPSATDNEKCISCGRCIVTCPRDARGYSGLKYAVIGKGFVSLFSKRKEPEWVIAE